jgi:hypothetical protein
MAFSIGSRGADVLKLQKEINAANKGKAGYVPLDEDGKYGPLTDAAYKAYTAPKVETKTDVSGLSGVKVDAPVASSAASPILDSNGNAYVIIPGGFSTIGKSANGSYALGEGERFATADEVGKIKPMISDIMSGKPITDFSSLSNFNMSGNTSADTGGYKDPFADKINALLDKFLNYDPNAYIDPTTLPQYGALKSEYDRAGQSAFNNQIGRLAALTGGRPSTAAVGTATDAQNEFAQEFASNVVPGLINSERANRQNTMNNILGQLRELQGLSNTAYERNMEARDDERQQFVDTIGQYSRDFTAEMNRIKANIAKGDRSEEWKLPYLGAAVQEKLAGMAKAKAEADETAYERAMELWKINGIVTSDEQARILGVPKGSKTADYANILADNARAAGGGSKIPNFKTASINTLGNPQQVQSYVNLMNTLAGDNKRTAAEKYNYILNHPQNFLAKGSLTPLSEGLYNRLLSELEKDATGGPDTGEMSPSAYKSNPDYAEDLTYAIQNPGEETISELKSRAQEFIEKYGPDGYKSLLSAASVD